MILANTRFGLCIVTMTWKTNLKKKRFTKCPRQALNAVNNMQ